MALQPFGLPSLSLLSGKLSQAAAPEITNWVNEIDDLLGSVSSLEEFRDQLLTRYKNLPIGELGALMQRALVAAELAGMVDVGVED